MNVGMVVVVTVTVLLKVKSTEQDLPVFVWPLNEVTETLELNYNTNGTLGEDVFLHEGYAPFLKKPLYFCGTDDCYAELDVISAPGLDGDICFRFYVFPLSLSGLILYFKASNDGADMTNAFGIGLSNGRLEFILQGDDHSMTFISESQVALFTWTLITVAYNYDERLTFRLDTSNATEDISLEDGLGPLNLPGSITIAKDIYGVSTQMKSYLGSLTCLQIIPGNGSLKYDNYDSYCAGGGGSSSTSTTSSSSISTTITTTTIPTFSTTTTTSATSTISPSQSTTSTSTTTTTTSSTALATLSTLSTTLSRSTTSTPITASKTLTTTTAGHVPTSTTSSTSIISAKSSTLSSTTAIVLPTLTTQTTPETIIPTTAWTSSISNTILPVSTVSPHTTASTRKISQSLSTTSANSSPSVTSPASQTFYKTSTSLLSTVKTAHTHLTPTTQMSTNTHISTTSRTPQPSSSMADYSSTQPTASPSLPTKHFTTSRRSPSSVTMSSKSETAKTTFISNTTLADIATNSTSTTTLRHTTNLPTIHISTTTTAPSPGIVLSKAIYVHGIDETPSKCRRYRKLGNDVTFDARDVISTSVADDIRHCIQMCDHNDCCMAYSYIQLVNGDLQCTIGRGTSRFNHSVGYQMFYLG